MERKSRRPGKGSGSVVPLASGPAEPTDNRRPAQLARLPRRLFRKIAIESWPGGWCARVVGFDARFYSRSVSPLYQTRAEALAAAGWASRTWGLPVITCESLAAVGGPETAA